MKNHSDFRKWSLTIAFIFIVFFIIIILFNITSKPLKNKGEMRTIKKIRQIKKTLEPRRTTNVLEKTK